MKRVVDIIGSAILLVVTAPLMAVVGLGVALTMGTPIVFRQQRLTRGGAEFTMYKFRSMKPEPPRDPEDDGPREFHAAADDPRHTPFGRFIRRFSLDELPQLVNVLQGDMSLIGPRPELPEVAEAFDLVHHPRHEVRPGMTGAWQVSEHRRGFVHLCVDIDAEYVADVTFRRDFGIAMRTFGVLMGSGEAAAADAVAPPTSDVSPTTGETGVEPVIDVRPIRVLHAFEPALAGVPAYIEKLGRELSDRGVEQYLLVAESQEWEFRDWPVEVRRIRWGRGPSDAVRAAREIHSIVDEHDIDLVHAHSTFAGIAARLVKLPVPLLYQPHGWGYLSTSNRATAAAIRGIERVLDGRADMLLTLSEQEAADAPPRRRSERVRPIVDLTGFEPLSASERRRARLEYGWSADERIHLCIGELSHRKNQVPLAASWRRLASDRDRLVFVGDGAAREALEKVEQVEIVGWRNDIARLMGAADTLVVPSLGEGFSLVILEALAAGLPVFSTPVGGSEVVSGTDGAVRTSLDDVVRAAVSSTLPDGETGTRIVRAQRHQQFASLDSVADDFVTLYRRALGRDEGEDASVTAIDSGFDLPASAR